MLIGHQYKLYCLLPGTGTAQLSNVENLARNLSRCISGDLQTALPEHHILATEGQLSKQAMHNMGMTTLRYRMSLLLRYDFPRAGNPTWRTPSALRIGPGENSVPWQVRSWLQSNPASRLMALVGGLTWNHVP